MDNELVNYQRLCTCLAISDSWRTHHTLKWARMSEFLLSDEILILMKKFEHNISIETHALDILLLIPTCNSRLTPPVHVVRDIHRATEYDISSICPCNYIHACIFVSVCVGRELQVAVADHDLGFVGIKEVSFLDPDDVMFALLLSVACWLHRAQTASYRHVRRVPPCIASWHFLCLVHTQVAHVNFWCVFTLLICVFLSAT